eukprot:COSAG06_NODE_5673_length_3329_cov_28.859133_4_plen_63_part_00
MSGVHVCQSVVPPHYIHMLVRWWLSAHALLVLGALPGRDNEDCCANRKIKEGRGGEEKKNTL